MNEDKIIRMLAYDGRVSVICASTTNLVEKANIQAKMVAVEDAHPRQPRCQYFGEELQMDACIHL